MLKASHNKAVHKTWKRTTKTNEKKVHRMDQKIKLT